MIATASIVLFKNPPLNLTLVLRSLSLNTNRLSKIFLIDNSPTNELEKFIQDQVNIEYIFNPSNPGFGAAHNIAIKKAIEMGAQYHFIVNPDVHFKEGVITAMAAEMDKNSNIGMMMPQILNLDGSIQNLPKLLPTPFSIILRKLKSPKAIYNHFINRYELRNVPKNKVYNAPILSGCFTLLNLKAIQKIGMYDDKFFMYFEDWDLSRRMHQKYRTIYFPLVSVYHGYEGGANKSFKLFKIYLQSAFYYFSKWGWFYDNKRSEINKSALSQFK